MKAPLDEARKVYRRGGVYEFILSLGRRHFKQKIDAFRARAECLTGEESGATWKRSQGCWLARVWVPSRGQGP